MHKSKLGGFIIDCRTDDLDAAAKFWGAAPCPWSVQIPLLQNGDRFNIEKLLPRCSLTIGFIYYIVYAVANSW